MRNNRKIIVVALFLSVLVVGIGYAAITTVNLSVEGTTGATPNQSNFKVEFTGTPRVTNASKVTAVINAEAKDTATISVTGLTAKGDTVSAAYTIKNYSETLGAIIDSAAITNSNTEYFKVETEYGKELEGNFTETTLASNGETCTLIVKVTLIKTPIENDVSTDITVKVPARPYNI